MSWLFYAILGALLAGASPVLAKSGMQKVDSHLASALRGTFLFFGAWFMANVTGVWGHLGGLTYIHLLYLLFSGIVTGVAWIGLLRALQLGEVIKVVPIIEGSMVLNILADTFLFHETLTWNKIIIMFLLLSGAVLMVLKSPGRSKKSGTWQGYALTVAVLTAVIMVLERIGYAGVNFYLERVIRYGIALIVVWTTTFATKGYNSLRSLSFVNGMYLCLSGVVMGGAWYCFYKAYMLETSAVVELVEYFDLAAAVFLGCIFMRERMTVRAIIGVILMMLGFVLLLAKLPVIPL